MLMRKRRTENDLNTNHKYCGRCQQTKTFMSFHKDITTFDKHDSCCKSCKQKLYKENKRRFKLNHKQYQHRLKIEVIKHYGNICSCCGEDCIAFLQIDHINGGGNKHRLAVVGSKQGGYSFYLWLRRNNFPKGFQVLCANCNMAKSYWGECPHKKKGLAKAYVENKQRAKRNRTQAKNTGRKEK